MINEYPFRLAQHVEALGRGLDAAIGASSVQIVKAAARDLNAVVAEMQRDLRLHGTCLPERLRSVVELGLDDMEVELVMASVRHAYDDAKADVEDARNAYRAIRVATFGSGDEIRGPFRAGRNTASQMELAF